MDIIDFINHHQEELLEIRIRTGKKIMILNLIAGEIVEEKMETVVTKEYILSVLNRMFKSSIYAYEQELRNGYFTIKGGHRVGISGEAIIEEGRVKNFRNISSMNIRIAHEVKGCSNEILPRLLNAEHRLENTLILSLPMCGKTTFLRDLARNLSYGVEGVIPSMNVGIVDERGEIAASFDGSIGVDLGDKVDVMTSVSKCEAVNMLVRSMNPDVIIMDEIGLEDDIVTIKNLVSSGVKFICSIHADTLDAAKNRVGELITDKMFKRIVELSKDKTFSVRSVFDNI